MNNHLGKTLFTALGLSAAGLLSGCSESGGSGGIIFVSNNTAASIGSAGQIYLTERWFLYQADEFTTGPGGTNLNSDGDKVDSVATLVNMATVAETNLQVAVDNFAILGTDATAQLYLVVDEAKDSRDWSGDGQPDDLVLLSVPATGASFSGLVYIADINASSASSIVVVGDRVLFVEVPAAGNPLAVGETAVNYVDLATPLVATRVMHNVVIPGTSTMLVDWLAAPSLVAADEGLVFFSMDETVEQPVGGGGPGVNLNAVAAGTLDVDMTDAFVLGALDGTAVTPVASSFGFAVPSDTVPLRALSLGSSDWLIGFLVSETDQGGTNFNVSSDPDLPGMSWLPSQCSEDADTSDNVLFWVGYQAFLTDPVGGRPVNTGLAGKNRVLAMEASGGSFVATISAEVDAGCDLNSDTDSLDDIFRWAPVGPGTPYFTAAAGLLGIADVAGGIHGISDLSQQFLAVMSESGNDDEFGADLPADPGYKTDDLMGSLDPSAASPAWLFDHSLSAGIQAAGSDWMLDRPQRDRLLATFQEKLLGQSINSGDTDTLDSVPTFALFDGTGDLDFPGPPVATQIGNAGTVFANGFAFYRVDEAADNRDWTGDNDMTDFVLFRTTVATLQNTNLLAVLNNLPRAAVESGGTIGVAFIASEAMANIDYNADGDVTDLVVRWFRIG